MRHQLELEIELPRERVIELFLDPGNLPEWQPDLVRFESLDRGETREVGAMSRQIHRMGRREVELIETITVHDPPDRFAATYESDGLWNLIENRFEDLNGATTRWILDSDCRVSGIARLMALFFPGMFKKQAFTFMRRFKEFAESSDGARTLRS